MKVDMEAIADRFTSRRGTSGGQSKTSSQLPEGIQPLPLPLEGRGEGGRAAMPMNGTVFWPWSELRFVCSGLRTMEVGAGGATSIKGTY